MAIKLGQLTINNILAICCDENPVVSGLTAPVGSYAFAADGSGCFYKSTSSDTGWISSSVDLTNYASKDDALLLSCSF